MERQGWTEDRRNQLPNISPLVRYRDVEAAIEWLCNAFGFEKQELVPGPDGGLIHAELRLGAEIIMPGSLLDGESSPALQETCIAVQNIDEHCERAKAASAEIIAEIRDTGYGSRDYSARDPEGHTWHFGAYLPAPSSKQRRLSRALGGAYATPSPARRRGPCGRSSPRRRAGR